MLYDVIILTEKKYLNPKKNNWYIKQVLKEDELLKKALEKEGLIVSKKSWDDKYFDWNTTKIAIIRTTWDYFFRIYEFKKWLNNTKLKTQFINDINVINWNIDKKYLKYLNRQNINISPTVFIEKRENITLKELFKKTKWKEIVIKPSISGAAHNTFRITNENYTKYEKKIYNLKKNNVLLFQKFQYDIIKNGEISIIIINNKFSHSVKKIAKKGDFRVQDDHGGRVENYIANKNEVDFAINCISKCPFNIHYARVDIAYDNNGNIFLCELELIEPEVWFRKFPGSEMKLAKSIKNILQKKLPNH